ncbi:MAG: OmpA family protein [Deltaproteobacteria bacterium]|nr:OmpA family protein [Deltaproteobacteria bacterium]
MARKKKPPEHANHERWLVSYADFITLLFAFFTTLYAISTVDKTKAGQLQFSMRTAFNVEIFRTPDEMLAYQGVSSPATIVMDGPPGIGSEGGELTEQLEGEEGEGVKKLAKEIKGLIESEGLENLVTLRTDHRGLVVSLAEAGFFDSGSEAVNPEALKALDVLMSRLARERFAMTIEGHTDNRPIRGGKFKSNWELSTARATHVVAKAIENYKVDPGRLSAAGYGEFRPLADNNTEDGRAKNRRVDIVVVANSRATDPGAASKAPLQDRAPAKPPAPASSTPPTPAEGKSLSH